MTEKASIMNNLDVAISAGGDSGLAEALKVSEKAIEITDAPIPNLYETRGQILYQMKRYRDAIPDLERALAAQSLRATSHRTLADCYAKLGDAELSKRHREAASKWEEQ